MGRGGWIVLAVLALTVWPGVRAGATPVASAGAVPEQGTPWETRMHAGGDLGAHGAGYAVLIKPDSLEFSSRQDITGVVETYQYWSLLGTWLRASGGYVVTFVIPPEGGRWESPGYDNSSGLGWFSVYAPLTPGRYTLGTRWLSNNPNPSPALLLAEDTFSVLVWDVRFDVNGDNRVDLADLAALADSYGRVQTSPGYDARADFDHDGSVDLADLISLARNYGRGPKPCERSLSGHTLY